MGETGNVSAQARARLLARGIDEWKKAARAIGIVQTRAIMLMIYLVAVLPMGFLFRLCRDPLRLRPPAGSNWVACEEYEATLERARRQF